MKTKHLLALMVLFAGLGVYTSYKLQRMTRIDATEDSVSRVVTDKTSERRRRGGTSCYLWSGKQRIQADCDYWETVNVRDRIEVVTVDDRDYVKGGDVYTSKGNYVIDIVLLVAECIGFLVCGIALVRRRVKNA